MRAIMILMFAGSVFAQEALLVRLEEGLKAARAEQATQESQERETFDKTGKWPDNKGLQAARIARAHAAALVWIEARLPKESSAFAVKSSDWEQLMLTQLAAAGIGEEEINFDFEDPGFNAITLELVWMPEVPNLLFATVGVKVRCGVDVAIYAYQFDANGWARAIADHSSSDWGWRGQIKLSDPDFQGRRLLLIRRDSVQCASTWMTMAYSVYRIESSVASVLFSGEHGFWLNDEPGFILKPDELMIEFLDSSVDGGIHNRTHLFRYKLADSVKRVEPFALQPQDFAEEWLTRPWSEMQPMSTPGTQKWHAKLHAEVVHGDYTNVVSCQSKPDRWAIGIDINSVGDKTFFLVRDLGNYRYSMEAVSDSPFEGCTGEGSPSEKHPWLSVDQLKALP